jgi:gluconolactonase
MKQRIVYVLFTGLVVSMILEGTAQAQGAASPCVPTAPTTPAPAAAGRGQGQGAGGPAQPVTRDASPTAIAGVVAAGAKWVKVWQGAGNSADGILADKDGNALVAQEDYDAVLRIDKDDKASVAVSNAKGIGSLSMDRQGRLYGAHRTERPGSTKPDIASIVNAITMLAPDRKMIAEKWADGKTLTVRPNDLAADGQGGAYFTSGCVFYAGPKGVIVVAENVRTNGIVFSPDDRTLYVTNNGGGGGMPGTIVAFDVRGPGVLANRRDFATLVTPNGDGLAVDTEGRLYVTANSGVQVFDKTGKSLGLIPTPRGVISVAFAGPDKKMLYVVGSGAEDANGQPIRQGPQQTAATVYKLPMIAQGVNGRGK